VQELRTPLNTAHLGLKLLIKEFQASTDVKDKERYDTLHDVSRSCEAAIDILNDLLCNEKIESGMLKLHKEDLTVLPYLSDCLSMFTVQARECGVTLSFDTALKGTCYHVDVDDKRQETLPLRPYDTVFADKFKVRISISMLTRIVMNMCFFTYAKKY
jgi:signal transduction histidine kinase